MWIYTPGVVVTKDNNIYRFTSISFYTSPEEGIQFGYYGEYANYPLQEVEAILWGEYSVGQAVELQFEIPTE